MLHLTSISNIGERRYESTLPATTLPAAEIRFQSRVEKSKRGKECQKIDGIPLMNKVKSILPYLFVNCPHLPSDEGEEGDFSLCPRAPQVKIISKLPALPR